MTSSHTGRTERFVVRYHWLLLTMNNMKYSILHISDLHRIADEDIDCIISSFELEKEKYKTMGIPPVKMIIVSGDIINGSKNENEDIAKEEISKQYDVAKKFLVALTELFLGSGIMDRMRVIMVPGNHDMSRYIARKSMEPIQHDNIDTLVTALWSDNSNIRWSWKKLQFFNIANKELYNQRFDDFIEFYNSFYQGYRSFPNDTETQSELIDLPELNIAIACFNSCYQLDHLRMSGYINPRSLSKLTRPLIEANKDGRLITAVWHHHTQGLPNENNYLDYTILDNMTQNGIQLAFHGHQHVSGILHERKDIFSDAKLTMFSAGTLYGNSADIPLGLTRQYNIISVDMQEDKCVLTLHSREDSTALNTMPAWVCGNIGRSKQETFEINVGLPHKVEKNPVEMLEDEINKINIFIEQTQDYSRGLEMLKNLDTNNLMVRKFILDISLRIDDYKTIKELFSEPQTIEEAFSVIDLCTRRKDSETFRIVLYSEFVRVSKDASLKAIVEDAKVQLKFK